MPDWISLALGVLKGILKAVGLFQEDLKEEKDHQEGKNEVAAKQLEELGEAKQKFDERTKEIDALPDADLDKRLDKWMRPK